MLRDFIHGILNGGGVFLNVLVVVGIVAYGSTQCLCGTKMGKRIEFYHFTLAPWLIAIFYTLILPPIFEKDKFSGR